MFALYQIVFWDFQRGVNEINIEFFSESIKIKIMAIATVEYPVATFNTFPSILQTFG